ncbi:MAG: hypothetical protein ABI131_06590 [Nostocoides sp.]
MDKTMTTMDTEIFGALAMSALPTHSFVGADCGKTQGITVSAAKSALVDPAYDGTTVVVGFGDRSDRTVAPTQTIAVATPRLHGPSV